MIPISDANPSLNKPLITIVFIWACVFVYIFLTPHNVNQFNEYLYKYAAIPCEVLNNYPVTDLQYYSNSCNVNNGASIFPGKQITLSLIYSSFIHSGFMHLLGNIWSLWIFGDNVEDKLGKSKTMLFLILASFISISGHSIMNSDSVIPIVGASGVVAAFMGAYFYLFPDARILAFLLIPFWMPITIKARNFMFFWIAYQLLLSIQVTNISWEAHLFGFLAGYIFVRFLYSSN